MAKLVNIFCLREADEDDPDYDADLDAATTPFKGADPFASRATGRVAPLSGTPGSVSVTNAKKSQMGGQRSDYARLKKPDAAAAASGPTDRPKYPGSFVGQVAPGGQQGKYKNVGWTNKLGQRPFGR